MRLWWIRLSPIISVKSAKTELAYSNLALQANIIVMVLACVVIILSDLPLLASALVIYLLIRYVGRGSLLVPAMRGELILASDGSLTFCQERLAVRKIVFTLDELCLLLLLKDGRRFLLWRDSMSDSQYRHIVATLKKEH